MLGRVIYIEIWRAARAAAARPSVVVAPAPVVARAPISEIVLVAAEPSSEWDPELSPGLLIVRDEELLLQEINGCKTLLLEIIRRAAYDWVLYRSSRRMVQRTLAEQAHRWLFVEIPGTTDWQERSREGKHITSFVSICESLDLDPDTVRRHIKRLTPKNVMSVGRPAEYRRRDVFAASSVHDEVYTTPGVYVNYDDSTSNEEPSY